MEQSHDHTPQLASLDKAAPSCCSHKADKDTVTPNTALPQLKDPVCGMTVTVQSPHGFEHAGSNFYFCSAGCKAKFAANPAKYLAGNEPSHSQPEPSPVGTTYTCPMHPEIR